jgi:hypothetical protein
MVEETSNAYIILVGRLLEKTSILNIDEYEKITLRLILMEWVKVGWNSIRIVSSGGLWC